MPDAPDTERANRQSAFHSVIDPILTKLSQEDTFNDSYLILDSNYDATEGYLFWKGAFPEWAQQAVESQAEIFPVRVIRSRYSENDLNATAEYLRTAWPAEAGTFSGVRLNPDRTSATVLWKPRSEGQQGIPKIPTSPTTEEFLPITNFERKEFSPLGWRGNDEPPWRAGSINRIDTGVNGFYTRCTVAATLRATDGSPRLLTAGHCGNLGGWSSGAPVGTTVQELNGDVLGTITVNRSINAPRSDIMLIDPVGAASSSTYIGTHSTYTPGSRVITNFGWSATNDFVCQNGATSGTKCSLRVGNTVNVQPWGFSARELFTFGGFAAAQGDSGGGIITYGNSQATIWGMTSAATSEFDCEPPETAVPSTCGASLVFIPIGNILNSMPGVSLY